jgi:hypothetical protein
MEIDPVVMNLQNKTAQVQQLTWHPMWCTCQDDVTFTSHCHWNCRACNMFMINCFLEFTSSVYMPTNKTYLHVTRMLWLTQTQLVNQIDTKLCDLLFNSRSRQFLKEVLLAVLAPCAQVSVWAGFLDSRQFGDAADALIQNSSYKYRWR